VTAAPLTGPPPVTSYSRAVATVGVEEQFLLLWPDGEAANIAPQLLGWLPEEVRARAGTAGYRVESATGMCAELSTVGHNVSIGRRFLAEAAADLGARLLAVGVAPFGVPGTDVTCGCHVTVGLSDPDLGGAVLERLRPWLPALIGLTGNSPLWRGRDTGSSSHRYDLQRRRPGFLPRQRGTDAERTPGEGTAEAAGGSDADHLLARLSPARSAIEIRLADTSPSVPDAVLLAGLCRALVDTAVEDELTGCPALDVPDGVLAAAAVAAARTGLAALVVSPGEARLAPAGQVVDELMTAVAPALEATGDADLLGDLLADRLRRGSGAERQRALWRMGRPEAFVQALANLCAGVDSHR